MPQNNKPTTLADRLAVAALSAVVGFVTAVLLWLVLSYVFYTSIPMQFIVWFTLVTAVLGFLTLENLLWHGLEKMWHLLIKLMRFW